MTIPVIVLLVLLVLKFLASTVLDLLNISYVKAHSGNVPDAFKSFMDEPTYKKGISYTIDKTKDGIILRIQDPASFWNASNYLIIQTN